MTSHPPAAASSQLDERHIPADVVGLKLLRIAGDGPIACDTEHLAEGYDAVLESLRRAGTRGRADVGGRIGDHFADLVNGDGLIVATVALDARSYRALKAYWLGNEAL